MVSGSPTDQPGSVVIVPGVITTLNANEGQVRDWFGQRYAARIIQPITNQLRLIQQKAELVIAIILVQARSVGQANAYTDATNAQQNRAITLLKTALFNDYNRKIRQAVQGSVARDKSILAQAVSFLNSSLDFTKQQVAEVRRSTSVEIAGIRFDIFNTFGGLIPGLPVLEYMGQVLSRTDVDTLKELSGDIWEGVKEFLKDPLGFILGWLISNLLDLILDLLASAIEGEDGELEQPVYSSEVSL